MKTKTKALIFLLGIGLLLAAAITFKKSIQESATVRLAYPPIVAALPIFVAEDLGLFQEKGINVEKVSFTSSNDMVNAMIAGQIDVLPAVSLIPVLHLQSQFPDRIKLFSHSLMTIDSSFDSIITKTNNGINDINNLPGRKIGVFPGTSATNMLKALLVQKNVNISNIEFIQLAPPAQIAALESGAIDALFSYEPITTIATQDAKYQQIHASVYASLLEPNPIGASVISQSFLESSPKVASQVVSIIDSAVTHMKNNPEYARSLLTKFIKISEQTSLDVHVVNVSLSTQTDISLIKQFTELLVKNGELNEAPDLEKILY